MADEIVKTDVDRLIDILKSEKKMELSLLAKKLNLSESTIQRWIDFLVEEKVIAIDYNLTKPVVSIIEKKKEKEDETSKDIQKYKDQFKKQKSNKKENSEFLWKNHITENLELMKQFFFSEAEKRKLSNVNELWEEYKKKVSTI